MIEKLSTEPINNLIVLNKSWESWNNIVKQVANKYIPFLYSSNKQFYALSLKATLLHQALLHIKKALQAWQTVKVPISTTCTIQKINKHITRANKLIE